MKRILFFGYGANRDGNKIAQITGEDLRESVGAVLEGYKLAYQTLDQVPQPARDVLKDTWGNTFRAYTLRKGEGVTQGVIWPVSEEGLKKIEEWEFIGSWRELIKVRVRTFDNTELTVYTEKIPEDTPTVGFIDGLRYDEFIFKNLQEKRIVDENQYYTQNQINQVRKALEELQEKS